jgi:hypothetical protein
MRPYFRDGRLVTIPRKRPARLALLDLLANQFEPGRRYSEKAVDSVLGRYHPDYCALRRYLVDEGFMERGPGPIGAPAARLKSADLLGGRRAFVSS